MYSIDVGFGWWRSCPRSEYKKIDDLNFNNHLRMKDQRKNLASNVQDKDCVRCWKDESLGVKSYRSVLKTDHEPKNSHLQHVKSPKILEIKFSNFCNLKCLYCSSKCSSLWEKDDPIKEEDLGAIRGKQLSDELFKFIDQNYEDIDCFQLFGGEPVLHEEFDQIFELIMSKPIEYGKKEISFSTNLFFSEKSREKFENNLLGLLEKGHYLYMRFSLDAIGEKGEYLRDGLDWNIFERNLKSFVDKFYDYPNVGRIKCNIALNALNLLYLDEIMKYLSDLNLSKVIPHYNYVAKPSMYSPSSFGSRLKHAVKKIEEQNFGPYDSYKDHVLSLIGTMTHLEPDEKAISDCIDTLKTYDNRKGKDFSEIFPKNNYLFEYNEHS
jgi:hypothetical protein